MKRIDARVRGIVGDAMAELPGKEADARVEERALLGLSVRLSRQGMPASTTGTLAAPLRRSGAARLIPVVARLIPVVAAAALLIAVARVSDFGMRTMPLAERITRGLPENPAVGFSSFIVTLGQTWPR